MSKLEDSCEGVWKEALQFTREILGEDDFEFVQGFESAEQLIQEVYLLQEQSTQSSGGRLLKSLKPYLVHLGAFAPLLAVSMGSGSISFACMWGVTYLLIHVRKHATTWLHPSYYKFQLSALSNWDASVQLGSKSQEALQEVTKYLVEFSDKLAIFELYSKSMDLDPGLCERFFSLLVDLVLACALAIKHFRKNGGRLILGVPSWNNVHKKFSSTLRDFTSRIEHLKNLVEATHVIEMSLKQTEVLESLSQYSIQPQEAAKLPYYQLPFGRNNSFFGRTAVLKNIQDALEPSKTGQSIHSVALWGAGGIGKSQVALEYANLQIQKNCQLVLWLPAQTEVDLSKALVTAASHVCPPGYEEGMSADRARYIMWNWLQKTDTSWLLIFDNVDDNELLNSNWPAAGCGQIVITCRSELIAVSPADGSVEIPPFTKQEGAELLLKLSSKRNANAADVAAAEELSAMLGGLALAIDITARQIFVKKKSLQQFLPYFIKNKLSLRIPPRYAARNQYYNLTLVTVWQTAFDSLDENSSRLLGLICFFAPDGIPRDMMNQETQIPGVWPFLTETDGYEEAEEHLLYMSLIKINDTTGMISIHRLIQEAYFYHLSEDERMNTFKVAYKILCKAFPKRILRRQMYQVWEKCEQLINHVEALQNKYEELQASGLNIQDEDYQILLADASWFCSETSYLQLGEKIGKRAAENYEDKESLIYAYLCESVATIDHRRGRYGDAYTFFMRSLSIREKEPTTTGPELADAYSTIGLALFGLFRSEEAIEFICKALAVAYEAPEELQHTYNIDRYLRNRSRPQAALGNFEMAKQDVAAAEAFQTKVYGPDSHFHGETAYILGKIAVQQNDLDLAMKYLQRAYDLQSPGKPTHQSVASALYHQALVCLLKPGDKVQADEQALAYLRHALTITQFNESGRGDQGESARVKWQISKIWERQRRLADATTYKAAALRTRTELERTKLYPRAPDEKQAWDCFSDLVDR